MQAPWNVIKNFANTYNVSIQWIDLGSSYFLKVFEGQFVLDCTLLKDGNEDTLEFETNFKANGNQKINQIDSDGAVFSRVKQAPTGWTYQLRGFEFQTSNSDSLINIDHNKNTFTDIILKFYDINGALITDQSLISANAVKTIVDVEPTYDYYIIAGKAKIDVTPLNDVRLFVIAVPDVPSNMGGSKIMVLNANFKYLTPSTSINADGRASKALIYNSTYHTNKIRFIIQHDAGFKQNIAISIEMFKL